MYRLKRLRLIKMQKKSKNKTSTPGLNYTNHRLIKLTSANSISKFSNRKFYVHLIIDLTGLSVQPKIYLDMQMMQKS